MRKRLVSVDEAKPATRQHTLPCGDCPFRRDSLEGWTGGHEPIDFVRAAHGEEVMDCHTRLGAQCAGSSVYRANVCKNPRNPDVLTLAPDRVRVFARPTEFLEHHES